MRRAGYTVVEVMAAVLILGIAFTALVQGLGAIRRMQAKTVERMAQGRTAERAAAALNRFLAQPGLPSVALPDRLSGDAAALSAQCSAPPCALSLEGRGPVMVSQVRGATARVALTGLRRPAFRYITTHGTYDHWPLAGAYQTRLTAIGLVEQSDAGASPVATVRLWSEQPQDCLFDSISAKCRSPLP